MNDAATPGGVPEPAMVHVEEAHSEDGYAGDDGHGEENGHGHDGDEGHTGEGGHGDHNH